MSRTIPIDRFYGSLPNLLRKYEKYGRQDYFKGTTREQFLKWQKETRTLLTGLLGLDKMESCPLDPQVVERVELEDGIVREKVILQVEPECYMPVYILIPTGSGAKNRCFLAPPGHQGAGKYSVAGRWDIPAVADAIRGYNYDYGMMLAKAGYTAFCPDCRGFGERRDEGLRNDSESSFLNSTCYNLAHMAEAMGETVIGMCTWDLMRLIDYIYDRGQWDTRYLGCLGFSGGGMQTLWLSALDERVKLCVISGYLYGYRDSLLKLHGNCSCNYVPGLYEHLDMGDIASLIAPRPVLIQSCRDDHLNGERGLINVVEQLEIMRRAYQLFDREQFPLHDVREGDHCFHPDAVPQMIAQMEQFISEQS